MAHPNAALTPRARLRLARLIVEDGWKPAIAAKVFMVSAVTARKSAARYRAVVGRVPRDVHARWLGRGGSAAVPTATSHIRHRVGNTPRVAEDPPIR